MINANPYDPPKSPPVSDNTKLSCQRRIDVGLIAVAFIAAVGVSIAMIAFPSLNAILRPRFGSSLTLLLFPVVHLGFYLWRPAPGPLWGAAFMTGMLAIIGGVSVWWTGTVDTVANAHTDRLHSAYLFSTIPALSASFYLTSIAWSQRFHSPMVTQEPPDA